ncbi:MAG: DivIVA domain-containing protein [Chthonomonadales bacterium]
MNKEPAKLIADFPRAVRGYLPSAVDEFVAHMGARLTSLQAELDRQTSRADTLQSELADAKAELAKLREKEQLITSAVLSAEHTRQTARAEADAIRKAADDASKQMYAEARAAKEDAARKVEHMLAEAEAQAQAIEAKAREAADAIMEQAKASARAMEAQASQRAEQIIAEAHQRAEDAASRLAHDTSQMEMALRTLRMEYADTIQYVRAALQAQLEALPPAEGPAGVGGRKSVPKAA